MSTNTFVVGCAQLNPGGDKAANVERALEAIRVAAGRGASLVALPEYATYLHASGAMMRSEAAREPDDTGLRLLCQAARQHQVWLLVGSIALATDDKLINRSYLVSEQGAIVAHYDKIHMFDATLSSGRVIRESSSYRGGDRAVVASTPWATLGMSVCYDLRFPGLYRALAQAGAEILAVPAAFAHSTGVLHWRALLQARAIENAAYVIAPATCGEHPGGHHTFGHAMVVDPDGQVLVEAGDAPEVICATIDLARVAVARARIPSLTHDRAFRVERALIPENHHG